MTNSLEGAALARRLCVPLIVAAVLGSTAFGQAPAPPDSFDAIFKDFATHDSPGCAVGAARSDRPLVTRAYGLADVEHRVQLTPQSVFYMGSVSKQFMALAILLLERDGKLRLDDRVRTYVPELPDYAATITIRHLLHHTSGVRDYLRLSALAGNPSDHVITERSFLSILARQTRLNFEAGSEHLYTNSGYVLLSIVVQRLTGRLLDEFARDRIFTPLNMRSTRFQHDHAVPIPGRASGYVKRGDSWRIANSLLDVVGDGGMYSTVDDMLQWATAFERPEFAPLLSRMQTPGTLDDGRVIANGYGMGLIQGAYRGLPIVSHGGGLAGYRTHFLRVPAEKLAVVVLCNNGGTTGPLRLAQMVAEHYASAGMSAGTAVADNVPPQAAPGTPVPRELREAAAGLFYSDELDVIYRIIAGSDDTSLEVWTNTPVVLSLVGPDRFATPVAGREITLVRDRAGRVTGFALSDGRVRDIAFTRR